MDAEDAVVLADTKGKVTFDDVVFGYTPDKTILHGISLAAKPGKTIAIVGPTGAGKTTIINLLMRFYFIALFIIRSSGECFTEFLVCAIIY